MDARLDHRLAWIIAAALVGSAACNSSNGSEPGGPGSARGGRDGGTTDLSACLAPSWFGDTAAMSMTGAKGAAKDDCRAKLVDLTCSDKPAAGSPHARPVADDERKSCKGAFTVRDEAEIESILAAIDDGQVAQAKLAATNASSQAVKDLAAKIIADHTGNQGRRRNLPNRTPAPRSPVQRPVPRAPVAKAPAGDGDIARTLNKGFADTTKTLADLHGADFDREFLARLIVQHRHTVQLLEDLAPQAKSDNVHTAIDNARELELTHEKLGCAAWADVEGKSGQSATHADDASEETSDDACEADPE